MFIRASVADLSSVSSFLLCNLLIDASVAENGRQTELLCILRNFDAAFPEALVIFLAGVLHDLPVGPQGEIPRVLPRPGEGPGIVDDHFVGDVTAIGPREALDEMQLIAVRMAEIGRAHV